ncbi:MAG: hypothetical protein ACE5FT_00280 [Candidatus Nanoarchaeia archaeon]
MRKLLTLLVCLLLINTVSAAIDYTDAATWESIAGAKPPQWHKVTEANQWHNVPAKYVHEVPGPYLKDVSPAKFMEKTSTFSKLGDKIKYLTADQLSYPPRDPYKPPVERGILEMIGSDLNKANAKAVQEAMRKRFGTGALFTLSDGAPLIKDGTLQNPPGPSIRLWTLPLTKLASLKSPPGGFKIENVEISGEGFNGVLVETMTHAQIPSAIQGLRFTENGVTQNLGFHGLDRRDLKFTKTKDGIVMDIPKAQNFNMDVNGVPMEIKARDGSQVTFNPNKISTSNLDWTSRDHKYYGTTSDITYSDRTIKRVDFSTNLAADGKPPRFETENNVFFAAKPGDGSMSVVLGPLPKTIKATDPANVIFADGNELFGRGFVGATYYKDVDYDPVWDEYMVSTYVSQDPLSAFRREGAPTSIGEKLWGVSRFKYTVDNPKKEGPLATIQDGHRLFRMEKVNDKLKIPHRTIAGQKWVEEIGEGPKFEYGKSVIGHLTWNPSLDLIPGVQGSKIVDDYPSVVEYKSLKDKVTVSNEVAPGGNERKVVDTPAAPAQPVATTGPAATPNLAVAGQNPPQENQIQKLLDTSAATGLFDAQGFPWLRDDIQNIEPDPTGSFTLSDEQIASYTSFIDSLLGEGSVDAAFEAMAAIKPHIPEPATASVPPSTTAVSPFVTQPSPPPAENVWIQHGPFGKPTYVTRTEATRLGVTPLTPEEVKRRKLTPPKPPAAEVTTPPKPAAQPTPERREVVTRPKTPDTQPVPSGERKLSEAEQKIVNKFYIDLLKLDGDPSFFTNEMILKNEEDRKRWIGQAKKMKEERPPKPKEGYLKREIIDPVISESRKYRTPEQVHTEAAAYIATEPNPAADPATHYRSLAKVRSAYTRLKMREKWTPEPQRKDIQKDLAKIQAQYDQLNCWSLKNNLRMFLYEETKEAAEKRIKDLCE